MVTRAELIEVLHSCGVVTLLERGVEGAFLDGSVDFPMGELRMDSLSAMEFCIALENTWGLSIAPVDVGRLGTLDGLLARLAGS